MIRVVRQCNRLSREAVDALSLEVSKIGLKVESRSSRKIYGRGFGLDGL